MSDAKRLAKISKLRALADHPNTPPHEAEAARNRIRALEGNPTTQPTPKATAEELRKLAADISRASRAQQTTRRAADSARTGFVDFDAAIRADQRTPAQRNADMQNAMRHQGGTRPNGCANPERFHDPGGNPRPRNRYTMKCESCGCELLPGEGAILKVGDVWKAWCCERVPGPRKKRF